MSGPIGVARPSARSPEVSRLLGRVPAPLPSRARLAVVAGVLAYCVLFHLSYVRVEAPLFSYLGATYDPPAGAVRALPWVLALLPSLWIPVGVTRPSHFFYWLLYLTVGVPSMFVPLYTRTATDHDSILYMLCMTGALAMLGLILEVPVLRLPALRIPASIFWTVVITLTALLDLYVLSVFHGNLRLASLANVYEQRAVAGSVAEGTPVNYATQALGHALDPFLIAWGLERRRPLAFALGALGEIFLYATGGDKIYLLSIPLIFLVRFALRSGGRQFGALLSWGISAGILVAWVLQGSNPQAHILVGLLLNRTLAGPGVLSSQYVAFFADHPHTHLAHVHGFNLFLRNPYDVSLGYLIGGYFSGNPTADANAHLWIEGVAGFGLPGILLLTPIIMAVFWMVDSARPRVSRTLVVPMLVVQSAILANGSIFSALAGGGLWLAWLLAWLHPAATAAVAKKEFLEA